MAFDISRVPNIALLFSDKLFEKNAKLGYTLFQEIVERILQLNRLDIAFP